MKKLMMPIACVLLLSSCRWHRLADLNMVSNRNIETSKEYVLIEKNAEGYARLRQDDALERAIDEATEEYNGEYMMNVKIYQNKRKIKVVGDVYAIKPDPKIAEEIRKQYNIEVGSLVKVKVGRKLKEGKIISITQGYAIVEYYDAWNGTKRENFPYTEISK